MPLKTVSGKHADPRRGRGAGINPEGRFENVEREAFDDGWNTPEEGEPRPLKTQVTIERAKSIISRNQSPDISFSQSINPYAGCEHGCIYCLQGETPILMADGRTRPLSDVRVGDEIYGTEAQLEGRRYVKQRVLAHWSVIKPAYRITLEDGRQLVSGGDHRFLSEGGWRFVTDTLAGSDLQRPHLTVRDQLMGLDLSALTSAVCRQDDYIFRQAANDFAIPQAAASLTRDIIGDVLTSHAGLRVVTIEPIGKMRLYDITTETEDFIANGVVSHNCYARPSHAYRNLSPGIDFETRLFAKVNAAELLRAELSKPGYACDMIMIGANTDPYQPIEREHKITRSLLQVCAEFNQPIGIITKNAGIERDIDILAPMAEKGLASVTISCNNLDHDVARRLEPRCAAPRRRLQAMSALSEAGIPVCVLVAPVVPFLTDQQIEPVLEAAWEHGAREAGYVLLRLPWEVKDLFRDWLERNYPLKAAHVMSRVHEMRQGRDNDPSFGSRMIGAGKFAELLEKRFEIACRRIGMNARSGRSLNAKLFRVPGKLEQMPLF